MCNVKCLCIYDRDGIQIFYDTAVLGHTAHQLLIAEEEFDSFFYYEFYACGNFSTKNRQTARPPQCTHNEPALQHYMDTTNKIMYYIVYYIVPEELSMPTMVDGPVAFII